MAEQIQMVDPHAQALRKQVYEWAYHILFHLRTNTIMSLTNLVDHEVPHLWRECPEQAQTRNPFRTFTLS